MAHPFLIKEIALQAGVGTATVDRALNGRAHVRAHTRRRIEQAIKELEQQQFQLATTGRKLIIDVVVEAPRRFADEIRDALDAEVPTLHPVIFRARFLMREKMATEEVVQSLRDIARRGSHGVFLKARDLPETEKAIDELQEQGIPVVTVFTDIPSSARIAYAGLDNHAAGATAAFLIGQWLGQRAGSVLITQSHERFRGEEQRALSFQRELKARNPKLKIIDASGGQGLDAETGERVRKAIGQDQQIEAVYSMGGGNAAILKALAAAKLCPKCFIAHDLDSENVRLLHDRSVTVVLHHDLRQDMRSACQHIMRFHRLLPAGEVAVSSSVVVVTPENIPAQWISRFLTE